MFSNSSFGMLLTIVSSISISIFLIYGGHLCWNYIKDNYSTKKTKDLVNTQIQKYKKIMKNLENSQGSPPPSTDTFLNDNEKNSMNQRLLDYMNSIEGANGSPLPLP